MQRGSRRPALRGSLVSALAKRAYCRESILVYQAPLSPNFALPAGVEIKHATRTKLLGLASFNEPQELEVFRRFLDDGHVGYLGYLDGICVHRSWYVPGPASIREHWSQVRRIGPVEGFVHYCKTAEAARGRAVFPAVLAAIADEHGASRTTMVIARENASSRRAASKAGWAPVEEVEFAVTLGVRRLRRQWISSPE